MGLSKEDWGEIARRHGVDAGALMRAGGATRPSADHIKALRTLDPLGLIKATIEALLLRQAQAARDYEPDNDHSAGPDPVFKLYTGDQTSVTASAAPTPPTFTPVGVVDGLAVEPTTGDDDNAEEDRDQDADIEDDATEGGAHTRGRRQGGRALVGDRRCRLARPSGGPVERRPPRVSECVVGRTFPTPTLCATIEGRKGGPACLTESDAPCLQH